MARTAIVEGSGIPEGTVSYCLNDKRFFEQLENGDWTINDFSKRGLERRAKTGSSTWKPTEMISGKKSGRKPIVGAARKCRRPNVSALGLQNRGNYYRAAIK